MSEQSKPYNQIDFLIQAPVFLIVFSYMDDQGGVSFVREYLLRLLKITPVKPEQIAHYFGFNRHETEIALADLKQNDWIIWQDDGFIALSKDGEKLFQNNNNSDAPKIPQLKELKGEYRMELLDNNFLQKKDCDFSQQNAIKLDIDPKILSEKQEIAQKTFQHRFHQLVENEIISSEKKDISLYKIDAIENKNSPVYFRFTQQFELLTETGEAKERCDISQLIYQENIQQAIKKKIEPCAYRNNLRGLYDSIEQIGDKDTFKILLKDCVDFSEFLKIYHQYDQKNGLYFLGQTYHHDELFKKIDELIQKDENSSKKLWWLAPSDIYWGKQRKIHDKLQSLINKQQNNYNFRLYLPLLNKENQFEKNNWKFQFKDISDEEVLYGFREGFLNGNTEILFLENKLAVVCYHAQLSAYPVTLPIGFMTSEKEKVKHIQNLVENYLSSIKYIDEEPQENDFGKLGVNDNG